MLIETDRLRLRRLSADDAPFMLALLNEPSFLRNVGDKGVRTLDDARAYILRGPVAEYGKSGLGMWAVEAKESGAAAGICTLLKRDALGDVDIGYAFLPEFWSRGYASEAAAAVTSYARETLGLRRLVAITAVDNRSSVRVLERLGFEFERMVRLPGDDADLKLFALDLRARAPDAVGRVPA